MDNQTQGQNYNVKLSVGKKFCYGIGEFGSNMSNGLFAAFFLIFCTDTFGVSAGVVGTVILLGRFWDMINDTWVGNWTDRTDTPKGKYLPWIKAAILPLMIVTVLGFWAHPEWSSTTKTIYVFVMYFAWAFAFTCENIPYTALTAVMTQDPTERASLAGWRMAFSNAVMAVQGILVIPLVGKLGGNNPAQGWVKVVIIFAIIGCVCMYIAAFNCKEVVRKPQSIEENAKIMESIKLAMKNKPYMIVCLGMFILGVANLGRMTSMTYYFTYTVQNIGLMGGFTTAQAIGGIIGALFGVPFLVKTMQHKGKVVALCSAIAVVGMIIQFVAQQNATVFLVGAFVQQFGTYSALTTIMSMMADCVELSLLNEGVRMDGFFSAFGYFWHKLGIALGSAATGWILGIMHYVPNAAEQAASVYTGINIMFFYIPTVLFVIMALAFLAYPISNKKFEEIVAQIAEKYGN